MSLQTTLRFLRACDAVDLNIVDEYIAPVSEDQSFIEITNAVTIKTSKFEFVEAYYGFEIIHQAGTLIGCDGREEIRTPHDNCILVMPSRRLYLGHTAVRLGGFIF